MCEEAKDTLRKLLDREEVRLTTRGNQSIALALRAARTKGKTTVLLADQGGWLTYPIWAKKENLLIVIIPTKDGIIDPSSIVGDESCVLLVNSMPAYACYQDMSAIKERCERLGILIINDATGSIGTPNGQVGDILLGSFGKGKPVPIGGGGFITGVDTDADAALDHDRLEKLLRTLPQRRKKIITRANKLKTLFAQALFRDRQGFNVIIPYRDESEKERLIRDITAEGYAYTVCPRSIRVLRQAICAEIKRMF